MQAVPQACAWAIKIAKPSGRNEFERGRCKKWVFEFDFNLEYVFGFPGFVIMQIVFTKFHTHIKLRIGDLFFDYVGLAMFILV